MAFVKIESTLPFSANILFNDFEAVYNSHYLGRSFEGFVIEEIIKGLEATTVTNWSTHYYRTRSGAEIDLILEGTFGTLPIEIKHQRHTPLSQLKTLDMFITEHELPFGVVVNYSNDITWLTKQIVQIPVGWL